MKLSFPLHGRYPANNPILKGLFATQAIKVLEIKLDMKDCYCGVEFCRNWNSGGGGFEGVPEFMLAGVRQPGANFITRRAPAFGDHPGGALEIVIEAGGVLISFFRMP